MTAAGSSAGRDRGYKVLTRELVFEFLEADLGLDTSGLGDHVDKMLAFAARMTS